MRKRILSDLVCPNSGEVGFELFAKNGDGGQALELGLTREIGTDVDVRTGLVVNWNARTAYPIECFVLSMLKDEDADRRFYHRQFTGLLSALSGDNELRTLIEENLARLAATDVDANGAWNQEEMEYYDREVATEEARTAFKHNIKTQPLWHIFIERSRYLLSHAPLERRAKVLEVGCGNARTVAWNAPPEKCGYNYIGTDISLKRLFLAKELLPESDFVQASAFTLPFRDNTFDVAIAFGVLHHLPEPKLGLTATIDKIRSGGVLLMHEPIEKQTLIPSGALPGLKKLFHSYDHSEHDNEINLDEFVECVQGSGHKVLHSHLSGSLLRTLLASGPMAKVPFFRRRWWWDFIIAADRLFVRMFCRKRGPLGPNSAFLVVGK